VLLLSVGGAPGNSPGAADLGPLGGPGGWRRLNVAITRARYRTEILSGIQAGDLPESATSEGLRQLRRYLGYAAAASP
jgi:superfamily I DNA and/or RNA helicase